MSAGDRRTARRYAHELTVDLVTRAGLVGARVSDVSRHGMFIVCENPPSIGNAVILRVHLDSGPFETVGTVVRHGTAMHSQAPGIGVQIYCMGMEAKNRWDSLVSAIEGVTGVALPMRPAHVAACFLIQLPTTEALLEFFRSTVLRPDVFYVSPAVPRRDAEIVFVLVHPLTHAEFDVEASVFDFDPARPNRMGVKFRPLDRASRGEFHTFLGIADESDDLLSFMDGTTTGLKLPEGIADAHPTHPPAATQAVSSTPSKETVPGIGIAPSAEPMETAPNTAMEPARELPPDAPTEASKGDAATVAPSTSNPQSAPMSAPDTPWINLAMFSSQASADFDEVSQVLQGVLLEETVTVPDEDVLLLDDEMRSSKYRQLTAGELDQMQQELAAHPALSQIDTRKFFDFNWKNVPPTSDDDG